MSHHKNIIIGAGPAGLAAGHELAKKGKQVLILEKEAQVGGLCRTVNFKGYKFDFGGHRFFTKNPEVEKFWKDILKEDFLIRQRLSRIYYQKKFFAYPVKVMDALKKLGLVESFLIGLSLFYTKFKKLFIRKKEKTFEDWVVNRFGTRLFNHFFKSYTEKLWGISVNELGADWAAQRMKDLSLTQLLKSIVFKSKEGQIKSLIEEFQYPKYGPGMLFEKVAEEIKNLGGEIKLNTDLKQVIHKDNKIQKIIIQDENDEQQELTADNFISSVPLNIMLKKLTPVMPDEIKELVDKMRFRAFFDVCLIVNKKNIIDDNWIYVHEPEVDLLRLQNFKNWSPFMSSDKNKTPIGAEYVCWPNDELWDKSDDELIVIAKRELEKIGLIDSKLIEDAMVIKNKYAYPVYHLDYKDDLEKIFKYLSDFKNLQMIGRSGLYRYNNMDHSILTGFYAARNIMGEQNNILNINADEEYHEENKS